MGQDSVCRIVHNGEIYEGRTLLETSEIIVRGDFRLKIPFGSVTDVRANDGRLFISWAGGETVLHLGNYAAKWADKIKNPPTLLDKLGVKAGSLVRLECVDDTVFAAQLEAVGAIITEEVPLDLLFYKANGPDDLARLEELKKQIKSTGGIWVVSPRGCKEIQDFHVIAAAKAAGLVDVKVCRFSETHTALKLVIPKNQR